MESEGYRIDINALCCRLGLGRLLRPAVSVSGGLLHRCFRAETENGLYMVKALNPQIMKREAAMRNYIFAENVTRQAQAGGLPAISAEVIDGEWMHLLDGQYYMIFPWVGGAAVTVGTADCGKAACMGELLARLHGLDFAALAEAVDWTFEVPLTDWAGQAAKAEGSPEWKKALEEYVPVLAAMQDAAAKAAVLLARDMVISHRDLDQKNVLWCKDEPMLIDWESAGAVPPMVELLEVARYWSGADAGTPEAEAFRACIRGYIRGGGVLTESWEEAISVGYAGKLGWLAYNVNRALGVEASDESERVLGMAQVMGTLRAIEVQKRQEPLIRAWLNEAKEEV